MHTLDATVFVYQRQTTGEIATHYLDEATPGPEYEHVATLNPKEWIRLHYKPVDNIEEHAEFQHHEIERLTDACQKLYAALSKIDYLCGEPNDMELSEYDVYMDECAVVTNVETLRRERDEARAECGRLREDAERYRWLRRVHENWDVLMRESDDDCWQDIWGGRLDAALDKARGKT